MKIYTARLRERVATEHEDERDAVLAALDRFDELGEPGPATADDLQPIVAAATSAYVLPGTIGMHLVLDLARRSTVATDVLLRFVTHDQWHVRSRVIAVLDDEVPSDLATELVRFAIHDRSSKVRAVAARQVDQLELDLVDELREQVRVETHRATRSALEWHLDSRVLGYRVEYLGNGNPLVSFRTASGWKAFQMTAAEMAAGRLLDRIDEERARLQGVLE